MLLSPDAMNKLYQDLAAQLSAGLHLVPDKPEETPDSTLCALWHTAAGVPVSAKMAGGLALRSLNAAEIERLQELIRQRISGIPLAHLTGRQHFMGLDLFAGREALIPRVETELLGWGALEALRGLSTDRDRVVVVDVCAGSGNLALALAYHAPKAQVYAADLSGEAVALARRNAHHLHLQNRVEFREGDLLAPFDEPAFQASVDLLVCNPPYISSRKVATMPYEIIGHEPRLAFDGGPFGIRIVERLIREAPRFLREGGCLAFEVGLGQGPALMKRLSGDKRYSRLRSIEDGSGAVRAIVAEARPAR
jgi:release factor glutamine methyltransferase